MFMKDPDNCTTRDIHQADRPSTCDINQGMYDALTVPITIVSEADIARCKTCWMGQKSHLVPHTTWRELIEQGDAFKDIMQRIIFTARFEDAMPSECEVILMWYEETKKSLTSATFAGEEYPRVQLDSSFIS